MDTATTKTSTREKLLDAAVAMVRRQGFAATSIDKLCAVAKVTKGAFFHHFASKEALGVAVAGHWATTTAPLFATAEYHAQSTASARVLAYFDLRETMIAGEAEAYSCLAGTLAQEVHRSHPAIARAAQLAIEAHAQSLETDIAEAFAAHGVTGIGPHGFALHVQAVLQGGFVLAKASGDGELARESVRHLKRYFLLLCRKEEE